ncbi:hypothetical protein [Staphylococcus pseudoxylosus]|uniref:hypothetical protein n=1 Tax=Staphylococcus pseudoxylosus TaxID=2282419 RepID=UPI000D1F4538|nr:hypothetical protein [Staphylococcus pseudoxylosus]MDW4093841.1 hypothetical protein [Staphylococcus saprophyticus]PTI83659.1 hypothetical protein BU098_01890 [Staphylococcus xylosus]MBM2657585.1 hypothetical protein [Staphylococcus pseudoxylosus]MCE5000958.1 hypothetical protein [Staphylococcus pseudoxylosus]MEB5782429.1 hypothetical protein [Staphylococcus pseudoxylosus]
MKEAVKSFYTLTLSISIGLVVAMLSDIFIGMAASMAIGFVTELTFSEMEHKKGLTCDNK